LHNSDTPAKIVARCDCNTSWLLFRSIFMSKQNTKKKPQHDIKEKRRLKRDKRSNDA
jgi:hypothetical protein